MIKHSNLIHNEQRIIKFKQRRYKCKKCLKTSNKKIDLVTKEEILLSI